MPKGVTCPVCGGRSHDREFCDHCNADLVQPAALLPPDRCPLFPDQTLALSPQQVGTLTRPEASIIVPARERTWRVHWIARPAWETWQPALAERLGYVLQALPPCRLIDDVTGVWLAAEVGDGPALPWAVPGSEDPIENLKRLGRFLEKLGRALEELHHHNLIWLTFDPGEIEEIKDADGLETYVRFTNLDLGVFVSGRSPERLRARAAFAAPEVTRFQAADLGPATDVFHLSLFAYYWLGGLLPQGFAGAGLESFGHVPPPLRVYAPALPPGMTRLLSRGLALEPRHRIPTPAAFCSAFQKVCRRVERRYGSGAAVPWEIGKHTRTGRAKSARGRDNEDYVLVRQFSQPERALVVVADGITTCDIGSGALASLMTCAMLENTFTNQSRLESFADNIKAVCLQASGQLLDWAVTKGYRDQLESGRELMGSTLLAGWLEGNLLTLANVGDSRAYLIDGADVEQLTVDGDLGTQLLASGLPPEEVRGLGIMARGLRECVGGCSINPEGALTILDEFCRPTLSSWPLLPGDVIILCSDGLVDEGVFLEPEKLGEIVRSHLHLSAAALAEQLAEAADALQLPPSPLEPDGFGDNITCIVIKIRSQLTVDG